MYCGHIEKFIHYPMWSWDKVQGLLMHAKHVKANDMIIRLRLHQFSCAYFIYTIQRSMCTKVQLTLELLKKFKRPCRKISLILCGQNIQFWTML